MRQLKFWMVVAVLALGATACSGTSGEAAVNSNEGLRAFMGAVALDLAQVMADLAPPLQTSAVKQERSTTCPDGGGATWTESGTGTGTLGLDDCIMRGITVNGTLSGFLESGPMSVSAQMGGPITVAGGVSGELFVTNLVLSAQIPITDEFTYWEVTATDADQNELCAWSGGPGCAPSPF
ncbi:MAG: hypothetical protein KJO40_17320 [Deltaproteobacteria bacterium]|nr:hypothetical protein [Deltaproteobacteria bacterium]NND27543.1 hypothetical protein [Myxococcales bacterium]RZV41037.1 MAG: hypothetical protein EX269_16895 [Acidimicrobiales bacterium]MBT8465689.1 hypothetical protein [Deltaproteobacteria bacterium]MBT8482234.1 hypothetical protein [Deltaproteobacteria bacterium]